MVDYKNMPKGDRMARRTEVLLLQREYQVKMNARKGAARLMRSEKKPEDITMNDIDDYLNPIVPSQQPVQKVEGAEKLGVLKKHI